MRTLLLETVHHHLNMSRQAARLLQDRVLIRVEGDELERDRQAAFECVLGAEPGLDGIVEVDAAGLQLGANRLVNPAGRAVLDLSLIHISEPTRPY